MKKWLARIVILAVALWLAFVGTVYVNMRKPPELFTAFMSKLPMRAMMLLPFQTLWTSARAGSLNVGDPAPDFHLEIADRTMQIRLSENRGVRPVVLVFGSYT